MSGRANYSLPLTEREIQVLHLVVKGYNLGEISRALDITYKTAETHKYNAIRKTKEQRKAASERATA